MLVSLREFLLKNLWLLVRFVAACACGIFVLYLFWLFFIFIPEFDISLPNGYMMVKCNSVEIPISFSGKYEERRDKKCERIDANGKKRSDGFAVGGKVTQYAVIGDIVFGENINSRLHPDPEAEIGYFILHTKRNICYLGMDRITFLNRLNRLGISEDQIKMKEPRPFDKQHK